jgi:hypothetical protein
MKKIALFVLLLYISTVTAQQKVYLEKEVDTNPGFPNGGWNSWISFVEKNFKWINEKNGKHIGIEFTVQNNGAVTDVTIINPNGSPNEKEALRVMSLSPKWTPALVKGKAVACRLQRGMFNPYESNKSGVDCDLTIFEANDNVATSKKQDDNMIYNYAGIEVKPEFPGGMEKFYDFFNSNFKMPEEENIRGKVFASFIVERDGSLSDVKVIRDFGYGTGQEVLRVLKKCPKWNPGIQNGKTVRVMYSLPFVIDSSINTTSVKK